MVGPHRVEHDEDHVRLRVPPAAEAEEGNHHQESACGAVLTSGHGEGPLALPRHAVRGYAGWREREPLVVEPGARRETTLRWQSDEPGADRQVDLLLFKSGASEPYRRLVLHLAVSAP